MGTKVTKRSPPPPPPFVRSEVFVLEVIDAYVCVCVCVCVVNRKIV